MIEKIVISGGPHSGKTTLQNGLREAFPNIHYIEEPASIVMRKANGNSDYWTDVFSSPDRFCESCVDEALASEAAIPDTTETAVFDRSLVDTVAYARRDGCDVLVPRVITLARNALYSTVLFCDFVGEYSNRVETQEEAIHTHDLLRQAYEDMDIKLIDVPSFSTQDRVAFISSILSDKLAS
jgi:predicted ATPase